MAIVLKELADQVKPGVSTVELNALAERRIKEAGGSPSFLGYQGNLSAIPFPSSLCASINSEVEHGPAWPSRILREGDIIGLDLGMRYPKDEGLCTDMAVTVGVGKISSTAARLIRVTKGALEKGIARARAGNRVNDIGEAIQKHTEKFGFSVVRELSGHGVGRNVHEDPEIPNFIVLGAIGDRLLDVGTVIAIEPMINAGSPNVRTQRDQWTVTTSDQTLSAHFEHTIAVTKDAPLILTRL